MIYTISKDPYDENVYLIKKGSTSRQRKSEVTIKYDDYIIFDNTCEINSFRKCYEDGYEAADPNECCLPLL